MWTASVVVSNPAFDRYLQVEFIERDQKVQTLAPEAATESLTCRVGHGRRISVRAVPIMNQKPVRMVVRQGLPKLLQCPFRRWVGSDVVNDPPVAQLQHHKYIEEAERPFAMITLAWLWTKVSQRCVGSAVRTGRPSRRYFATVRDETRIPSFNFNSLATRSSPQLGLSLAISRIHHWRFFGKGVVPAIWISSARKGEIHADANEQKCQV